MTIWKSDRIDQGFGWWVHKEWRQRDGRVRFIAYRAKDKTDWGWRNVEHKKFKTKDEAIEWAKQC